MYLERPHSLAADELREDGTSGGLSDLVVNRDTLSCHIPRAGSIALDQRERNTRMRARHNRAVKGMEVQSNLGIRNSPTTEVGSGVTGARAALGATTCDETSHVLI